MPTAFLSPSIGLTNSDLENATASASDVLRGKTFYAGNSTIKTGTIPVMTHGEAKSISLWTNGSGAKFIQGNTIPVGYYKSNGEDYSPQINIPASLFGNAARTDVLSGKTFTSSNGAALIGSMTNRGAWNATINPGDSVTIPQGWHNGGGVVRANNPASGWRMRYFGGNADNNYHSQRIGAPDGNGTYAWGCSGYVYWGNENTHLAFDFQGQSYPDKMGNYNNFMFYGTNYFDGNTTLGYRIWGGNLNFYYCRVS